MITTRFEQDLRLLTREKLTEKYGSLDWDGFYNLSRHNVPIPAEFVPRPLSELTEKNEYVVSVPSDLVEVAEEVLSSAPPYKGRAFGKFVMIRRLEAEHSGHLVMPERIAGTSDIGWVASVGEETKYVKKGMIVVFDQYAGVGRECRLADENGLPGQFLLIEEPDILAILEKI